MNLDRNTRGRDLRWLDRKIDQAQRRHDDVVDADYWAGDRELDPRYMPGFVAGGIEAFEHLLRVEARMDTFPANPPAQPEEE